MGNILVNEYFTKDVLEKRRELLPPLKDQHKNLAFQIFDKLIIKGKESRSHD